MVAKRIGLARARKAAAYTQESLAAALHVDTTTIGNWEAGRTEPVPFKRPKLARLLRLNAEQLEALLREGRPPVPETSEPPADGIRLGGDHLVPPTTMSATTTKQAPESPDFDCSSTQPGERTFHATSHMFVPVFLGTDLLDAVIATLGLAEGTIQGVNRHAGPVAHPDRPCTLYVFPWGVSVFHLTEELCLPTIASLAVWRRQAYRDVREWITSWLKDLTSSSRPVAHYVLSAYWVRETMWRGPELKTAMRLLSMPRVLLDRGGIDEVPSLQEAETVERSLLRDGFQDGRIDDFGITGLSIGCASWAGVSYYPLAPGRAIQEADLVDCELLVQALWCYCHQIREQVEDGLDPVVAPEFGWRWVRAMRSRLTVARPQETAQHGSMRRAVLETSELGKHLTATVDLLRDTTGE